MVEMSRADVPDELVEVATQTMSARDTAYAPASWWADDLRAVLAAVLPLHEQRVRAAIAAELRAVIFHCPTHDAGLKPTFDHGCIGCQRHAALVGAAQLVAGHESPSVKAVRDLRQLMPPRATEEGGGDD